IRLNGSADGVFGDMGINPALSSGTPYSQFRNQLPPDVIATPAINGPRITAGFNIGRIILTNGSIFEAFIFAGRAIGTIDVTGDITTDSLTTGTGTVIAAGSSIFTIHATGVIANTDIIAGVRSFGDDGRPGGTGGNADTVRSGRITNVLGDAGGVNVRITAGMVAGADGVYNTADDLVTAGISYVRAALFGSVNNVSVFADSPTLEASPGVVLGGTNLPNVDQDISPGTPVGVELADGVALPFTWNGVSGTILFSGGGRAFWDAANGRLHLVNTRLTTNLTIDANGTLTDFKIVTNDDASMGAITVNAPLAGNSLIIVDAYTLSLTLQAVQGNTQIRAGMNIRSITTGEFSGGSITSYYWARDIVINGAFGTIDSDDEATIRGLAGANVTITGNNSGLITYERDLAALSVGGVMQLARLRVGASLGELTAGSIDRSRISVADRLGSVIVAGDVFRTSIMAGGDLGDDAAPGGVGFNADRATTGSIGSVRVGGNFTSSDIIAGMLRGTDAFFGTADDLSGQGISSVGNVNIEGQAFGSNVNSEQYRIAVAGDLGAVMISGLPGVGQGNFRIENHRIEVTPIRVVDVRVEQISN